MITGPCRLLSPKSRHNTINPIDIGGRYTIARKVHSWRFQSTVSNRSTGTTFERSHSPGPVHWYKIHCVAFSASRNPHFLEWQGGSSKNSSTNKYVLPVVLVHVLVVSRTFSVKSSNLKSTPSWNLPHTCSLRAGLWLPAYRHTSTTVAMRV